MITSDFECDLISTNKWNKLYDQMPKECRKLVDDWQNSKDEMDFAIKQGGPIGIGKNHQYGWFISGCGQGPCLLWKEKHNE